MRCHKYLPKYKWLRLFRYAYTICSTSVWINQNRYENNHKKHYRAIGFVLRSIGTFIRRAFRLRKEKNSSSLNVRRIAMYRMYTVLKRLQYIFMRSAHKRKDNTNARTALTNWLNLMIHSIEYMAAVSQRRDFFQTFLFPFFFFVHSFFTLYFFIWRVSAECTHQKGDSHTHTQRNNSTECHIQCAVAANRWNYIHKWLESPVAARLYFTAIYVCVCPCLSTLHPRVGMFLWRPHCCDHYECLCCN